MTTAIPDSSPGAAISRSMVHPADTPAEIVEPPNTIDGQSTRGGPWSLWGASAAVAGLVAGFFSLGQHVATERPDPHLLMESLHRPSYHAAFLFGLVAFASLLIMVAGLHRWADYVGRGRLAARVIPIALTVTAVLVLLASCAAGSLALYLPGGADHGVMWTEGLFVNYMMLDFGMLIGWWGAAVAAVAAAGLAFGPERLLPQWFGIASVGLVITPVGVAVASGLPGLVGMILPIWLLAFSFVLLGRNHR